MAMQKLTNAEVIRALQMVRVMGYGQVTVKVKAGQIDGIETTISVKQSGELDRMRFPRTSSSPVEGTA